MPERLTESLIRRGQLTKRRAEEATNRQVLMGGALDTSLLELGHIEEDDLIEGMAAAYGLATASPRHARADRDERALRAFPEQWAEKHLLAPLGFDEANNTLSVLSPAPADVNLIVRLGDLLEVAIRPLLAPEFRVQERIAFLYGRPAPERFRALIDQHQNTDASARSEAQTVTSVKPYVPEPESEPAPEPATEALSFGEAVSRLRDAEGRDEIVEVTLRYAIRDLQHASVFINHDDGLEGWRGYGPGGDRVPKLHVDLAPESAFRVVLDTRAHYLGPLPKDSAHEAFLSALGRPHPRAVLIVPIRIQNRTVALLYGENGEDPIAPRIAADLMLFTTHVQVALSELLLRRKAETLSELTRADDPIEAELLPIDATGDDVLGPPTVPMQAVAAATNGANGAHGAIPVVGDGSEDIQIEEATPYVESSATVAPEQGDEWEPVDVDGLDDLGNELDQTIAAAQAALRGDQAPPEPTSPLVDPFSSGSIFNSGDLERLDHSEMLGVTGAVSAESADGQNLLQELDELEAQLSSDLPVASASSPDDPDGWESVDVDNTWDGDSISSPAVVSTLRSSLTEDATVPDLSAEAWLRASSETTRARPLPPEVMERAAMPAAPDPVPLTRITVGQIPASEVELSEPDFDEEPVPLTHRTSSVVSASPLSIDEEPVPLTKLSTTSSHSAMSIGDTLLDSSNPFAFDEDIGPSEIEKLEADHVVDAMGRLVPVAESQITPPAPLTDPTTRPSHLPRDTAPSFEQRVAEQVRALDTSNDADRQAAVDVLMRDGPNALPVIGEHFPGPLLVDPFMPEASNLPPFAKCGPLLSILERHGRDAHPYVARYLDAPDPLSRFFAIYFYAAVYVPEAIPRLIQRLHDEESRICMLGARTLFAYREHPEFVQVLDHLHGRLEATSLTARRHATYLIGLFRDVTAIPNLIDVLDQKEKGMLDVAEDALAEITKQRFGHSPKKWRAWWSKNRAKSRIEWLIDGLAAKEPVLRRSAAEELRAVTGLDMGYDEEAPKRLREEAKKRWSEWWSTQAS